MAFLLIGASTKTNDASKIGEFGSGANYAAAWLLRNGYDFGVYSGKDLVTFSKVEKKLGDQTFEAIVVNDQETSFTTTMGKKWKAWYVLREFWSNALDEGGASVELVEISMMNEDPSKKIQGEEGVTRIYIEARDEVLDVWEQWDDYFAANRTDLLAESNGMKVYAGGENLIVYRKGIQVYSAQKPCAFHYDLDEIDINESRVVSSMFELEWRLNYRFAEASEDLVRLFLKTVKDDHFESNLDYNNGSYSSTWSDIIGDRPVIPFSELSDYEDLVSLNNPVALPHGLARKLMLSHDVKHLAGELGSEGIYHADPTEDERLIIEQAQDALAKCGYVLEHEIKFCKFKTNGVVAQALNGKIFLSSHACRSVFYCVTTLIEETEHHRTGFGDESRQFQQHFIDLYAEALLALYGVDVNSSKQG